MKWPFTRKNKEIPEIPEEFQTYYEAEKKERKGMAWLLGLATLAITILLALVLFFAGRWIVDKITGDDEPEATTAQTEQTQTTEKPEPTPEVTETPEPTPSPTPEPTTSPSASASTPTLPRTGPTEE